MICAAAVCVPGAGLVAFVLGWLAMIRIRESRGALLGTRLARWGAVLGIAITFLQCAGLEQFQVWNAAKLEESMVRNASAALLAAQDGDAAAFEEAWFAQPDARPDEAARLLFAEAIRERFGRFERLSITHAQPDSGGTLLSPVFTAALVMTFEEREVFGAAKFRLVRGSYDFISVARPISLEVVIGPGESIRLEAGVAPTGPGNGANAP